MHDWPEDWRMGKKQEAIDGTTGTAELVPYELPPVDDEARLDLIQAETLEEIEAGIRSCEKMSGALAIIQGIGILKAEAHWMESPYGTLQEYREHANERYGMSSAVISQRRKMARAWLDNTALLRKIDLTNKSIHLLYLEDALANHERREVVSHLKADTFREFKAWATGREARAESLVPDVSMSFREGTIYADDTPIMTLEDDADETYREPIADVLRGAFRAWKGKCLAHVVPVYDAGEARAVDRFLKEHRAKK